MLQIHELILNKVNPYNFYLLGRNIPSQQKQAFELFISYIFIFYWTFFWHYNGAMFLTKNDVMIF